MLLSPAVFNVRTIRLSHDSSAGITGTPTNSAPPIAATPSLATADIKVASPVELARDRIPILVSHLRDTVLRYTRSKTSLIGLPQEQRFTDSFIRELSSLLESPSVHGLKAMITRYTRLAMTDLKEPNKELRLIDLFIRDLFLSLEDFSDQREVLSDKKDSLNETQRREICQGYFASEFTGCTGPGLRKKFFDKLTKFNANNTNAWEPLRALAKIFIPNRADLLVDLIEAYDKKEIKLDLSFGSNDTEETLSTQIGNSELSNRISKDAKQYPRRLGFDHPSITLGIAELFPYLKPFKDKDSLAELLTTNSQDWSLLQTIVMAKIAKLLMVDAKE